MAKPLSSLSADQLADAVEQYLPPSDGFARERLAELVRRLKTADATVDELATELAEERTLHQATLGRLKTAEDALDAIIESEKRWLTPATKIARAALAAIRPNPEQP